MRNRRIFSILWLLPLYLVQSSLGNGSDSLRSALEAVTRRQRDLSDPSSMYYLDPQGHIEHLGREIAVYVPLRDIEGEGQPEDIGYGYQKSITPNTAGIFESIALPKSELGIHDMSEMNHPQGIPRGLDKLILDYMVENSEPQENENTDNYFRDRHPDSKRSVFRERGDGHLPDALQQLYLEDNENFRSYEDQDQPRNMISPFRERFKGKSKPHLPNNVQPLIRNFGGLDRDTESQHDSDDESDEYMNVLNSVWEKYKNSNLENFDPEDISESDISDLIEYMDTKTEKKRQYGDSYQSGYDFFNSPFQWAKRSRQKSADLQRRLNNNMHEYLRDEEVLNNDLNKDSGSLLIDRPNSQRSDKRMYRKRLWQGSAFDERYPYKNIAKRYPVAKRSPSPSVLYHKSALSKISQRKKKSTNSRNSLDETDPKVVEELSDIFSASNVHNNNNNNNNNNNKHYSTKEEHFTNINNNLNMSSGQKNESENKEINNNNTNKADSDVNNGHKQVKRTGQKEESVINSLHKPLEISKKSVDWSDYFGIDRRRKKSSNKNFNDEWLLNQYLKAYSLPSQTLEDSSNAFRDVYSTINRNDYEPQKKGQDDMDAKLRAMEDLIVDQALKYTGAHEGMTDSNEVQEVKDKVISQLAAAYSLEKMRRALGEFKSSIAAQKVSAPRLQTKPSVNVTPTPPEKRVAVKKENADNEPKNEKMKSKDDMDNDVKLTNLLDPSKGYPQWSSELFGPDNNARNCPILKDVSDRCKEVADAAGDINHVFLPLCGIHQICNICDPEQGGTSLTKCDTIFLNDANSICQDNASCRYTAHQTVAALRALKGELSSVGCDWQNHPCLAYFLSVAI